MLHCMPKLPYFIFLFFLQALFSPHLKKINRGRLGHLLVFDNIKCVNLILGLGYFSEQAFESMHADIKVMH